MIQNSCQPRLMVQSGDQKSMFFSLTGCYTFLSLTILIIDWHINRRFWNKGKATYQPELFSFETFIPVELEVGDVGFLGERNCHIFVIQKNLRPEKTPQWNATIDNKLNPHMGPGWNSTRVTYLVGGVHSHHCTIHVCNPLCVFGSENNNLQFCDPELNTIFNNNNLMWTNQQILGHKGYDDIIHQALPTPMFCVRSTVSPRLPSYHSDRGIWSPDKGLD